MGSFFVFPNLKAVHFNRGGFTMDAQTCPDCGVKMVNGVCPECGKKAGFEKRDLAENQINCSRPAGWGSTPSRGPKTSSSGGFGSR